MKGRYIALVAGDPRAKLPEALLIRMANQPDFRIQHRSQDLIVWCEGDAPFISLGGHGLILGHLFCGCNPATRINHLSDSQSREIAGSRGASLMAQYWGGYVAILRSGAQRAWKRSGSIPGLPVFMCDHGDCKVLATHVDDFETLGLRRPTVDMAYVAAHLQNTGFRYRRTALTGITELPPGNVLPLAARWALSIPCGLRRPSPVPTPKSRIPPSLKRP
jgi:asparagine synthase (glutamine-hydrolysing)